jgi:hypothetical protein
MRTAELKAGEAYFADFDYSEWQIIPIEAATWTQRRTETRKSVTELVAPETPFDPMTGEPNPQIEHTRIVREYGLEFVTGSHPGRTGAYYFGEKNVVGVPCFARRVYTVKTNGKFEPGIVRPNTIKSTWSEYVAALRAAEKAEVDRKAARLAFDELLEKLNLQVAELLGVDPPTTPYATQLVSKDGYGSGIRMNAENFQKLIERCLLAE